MILTDGTLLEADETSEECWVCGRATPFRCTIVVPLLSIRPGPTLRRLGCCSVECHPHLLSAYMLALRQNEERYYDPPALDFSKPWAGAPKAEPMTAWQEIKYVWQGVFG